MGVKSVISSKQYNLSNELSKLVVNACLNSMPKNPINFNVDNIRTVKILGKNISDSFVINGMVLERKPKSILNKINNCNTAVFTCPLESTQTETKGTVLLHNANELLNYTKSEEEWMNNYIKKLKYELNIGLLIIGEKISEIALHYIDKYKLVAIRLSSKWTLRRLCRTLNSRPIVQLQNINKNDLGYIKEFYTKEIGNDIVSVFSQIESNNINNIGSSLSNKDKSEVSTIIIRGSTKTILNDVERAIDDGVNIIRSMTKNGKFIPGAGASEIECSRILNKYSNTIPGLEQYAIKSFAKSLEIVPRTLAQNTGIEDTKIIAKLYKSHETGIDSVNESNGNINSIDDNKLDDIKQDINNNDNNNSNDNSNNNNTTDNNPFKDIKFNNKLGNNCNIGVDIKTGNVKDMTKEGIIDLMMTRQMGVKLATQAANTILKVDHIIMKKPSGGPRKPNRGHWDDNDDTW